MMKCLTLMLLFGFAIYSSTAGLDLRDRNNHRSAFRDDRLSMNETKKYTKYSPINDRDLINDQDFFISKNSYKRSPQSSNGPPNNRGPPKNRGPPPNRGPPDQRGPPNQRGPTNQRGPPENRGSPNREFDYRVPADDVGPNYIRRVSEDRPEPHPNNGPEPSDDTRRDENIRPFNGVQSPALIPIIVSQAKTIENNVKQNLTHEVNNNASASAFDSFGEDSNTQTNKGRTTVKNKLSLNPYSTFFQVQAVTPES